MSHDSQLNYITEIKDKFPRNFKDCRVLEVGSLDINGSVRQFFENCSYLGLDIGPGPGVDLIVEAQRFDGSDNYYDTVISCECFEHNPFWLETFLNMWRMTKPNGMIIFSCATTGRVEHGTTRSMPQYSPLTIEKGWNYYKNLTEADFRIPLNFDWFFSSYSFAVDLTPPEDLFFWGIKRSM